MRKPPLALSPVGVFFRSPLYTTLRILDSKEQRGLKGPEGGIMFVKGECYVHRDDGSKEAVIPWENTLNLPADVIGQKVSCVCRVGKRRKCFKGVVVARNHHDPETGDRWTTLHVVKAAPVKTPSPRHETGCGLCPSCRFGLGPMLCNSGPGHL